PHRHLPWLGRDVQHHRFDARALCGDRQLVSLPTLSRARLAARAAEPASLCAGADHLGSFSFWLLPPLLAHPGAWLHWPTAPSAGCRPRPLPGNAWPGVGTADHAGPGGGERLLLACVPQLSSADRGRARAHRGEASLKLPCACRAPLLLAQ